MIAPRAPLFLTHARPPDVRDFAIISALEAGVRGTLLSVMPLVIYRAYGDAAVVSHIYLIVGFVSLAIGLFVPWATRYVPRRWMFTCAGAMYLAGMLVAIFGPEPLKAVALLLNAAGTVTYSVCLSAYVLDYISRSELGRNEGMRMTFSAPAWTIGPVLGVWLLNWWPPAPFILAGFFSLLMVAVFWRLRLGNGKQILRARRPAPNPLAYVGRFFTQPRLIAGWLFAVIRSTGWWVFIVYLPIYCIENGLGETVGSYAVSLGNALLFLTPFFVRTMRRYGVRLSVMGSFWGATVLMIASWAFADLPWATYGLLLASVVFLVMLDVCASLPFLMAVKPSERTEMAAIFSSFRDVSGILTPGVAALVLLFSPVAGVFAACGAGMGMAAMIASRLHPRLGVPRVSPAIAAQ